MFAYRTGLKHTLLTRRCRIHFRDGPYWENRIVDIRCAPSEGLIGYANGGHLIIPLDSRAALAYDLKQKILRRPP
jgi:hypothetical protein